jgi:hypothetical protein
VKIPPNKAINLPVEQRRFAGLFSGRLLPALGCAPITAGTVEGEAMHTGEPSPLLALRRMILGYRLSQAL